MVHRVGLAMAAAALVVGAFFSLGRPRSGGADEPPRPADPASLYDPIVGGEPFPGGIRWVISRDGIRPVYDPVVIPAAETEWDEGDLVIGLEIDGVARAYPVEFLSRREMVNDSVSGVPVLVTWCPNCGTGMVHRRSIDGDQVLFGNQGALWGNAMTWWDHETGSIWSQPLGEAIAGPMKGKRLDLLGSTMTTWGAWRDTHPGTTALQAATDQSGFRLDTLAIVVELGGEATAYPIASVREIGALNDVVAGAEVGVVIDPADEDRWAVFSRRLAVGVVTLAIREGLLIDIETGSTWDPTTGQAISGPLTGEILEALPAATSFPKDFFTFWPSGTLWVPQTA